MPVRLAFLDSAHRTLHGPGVRMLAVVAGLAGGRTAHSEAERACLRRHADGKQSIVELGVHEGGSTTILRSSMSSDGRLYAVDPFPSGRFGISIPRIIARVSVARVHRGVVHGLRMTDTKAAEVFSRLEPAGADLVFSDCVFAWDALEREWRAWRDHVAPGGVFIQTTSRPVLPRTSHEHEVVRFTREVLLLDPDFECVDAVGTFTVLSRRPRVG